MEHNGGPTAYWRVLRIAGNVLATLWIFGGGLFFFARFSSEFRFANQALVDKILEAILY